MTNALSLRQCLEHLKSFASQQSTHYRPRFRIHKNRIFAYNGRVAGSAEFFNKWPDYDIVVDAEALDRVWQDSATAAVDGDLLIVKTRRTSYKLPLTEPDLFECPPFEEGGVQLSYAARDAILLASKFASDNAIHPWACGVTLHEGRAIATNNVAVVSVECSTPFEGTLPFWAIELLRSTGETPKVRLSERGVSFTYSDGVTIFSAPFAASMPPKLFEVIAELPEGNISTTPIKEVEEDAFKLNGTRVVFDLARSRMEVFSEHNASSITDIDMVEDFTRKPVTMQSGLARLILANSTHIGLEQAPHKMIFSRDIEPKFRGIAAAMV